MPLQASVKDMFFFLHGPTCAKKVAAVFYGFFDGSNTHAGARVWTLCGFLGDDVAFGPLDDEWKRVLAKPCWPRQLSRFHMFDCVHGHGEFLGWSFAERLGIFGELATLIMASPLVAIGSVVITEDFAKLTADERNLLRSEGLGEPLDLSLQYVYQTALNLTRETSDAEQIGLLFDNENPATQFRCMEFLNLYKTKFGYEKWFAGIGFGESVAFTPLQAADILAYCTYRFTMLRYPQNNEPDFPVIPGFERMINGVLNHGGGFDLESMKQLAAQIKERRAKSASA
jgi:hypothetical protein